MKCLSSYMKYVAKQEIKKKKAFWFIFFSQKCTDFWLCIYSYFIKPITKSWNMIGGKCEEARLLHWLTIQNFQRQSDQFTSMERFFQTTSVLKSTRHLKVKLCSSLFIVLLLSDFKIKNSTDWKPENLKKKIFSLYLHYLTFKVVWNSMKHWKHTPGIASSSEFASHTEKHWDSSLSLWSGLKSKFVLHTHHPTAGITKSRPWILEDKRHP